MALAVVARHEVAGHRLLRQDTRETLTSGPSTFYFSIVRDYSAWSGVAHIAVESFSAGVSVWKCSKETWRSLFPR